MNITPLDIRQKQFKLKFRGFDMREVDSFLEEVTEQMESLVRDNESLKEQLATSESRLNEFMETERELRNTLMAAHKMSEEIKAQSEREAELRIKEAELEAERMLAEARRVIAKTQNDIEELKRIKERFSVKLKGLIEDHLKMIVYEERQERLERQGQTQAQGQSAARQTRQEAPAGQQGLELPENPEGEAR
ncbi:MAG: DivIVA domain-containing protein [Nitrospirae bacterium]|nr:DivIVA domain-containing protein [Nitrospirota bacterium]MBI5695247.1 DivIVA domain-containing protein [Nitrospirota bacterium]